MNERTSRIYAVQRESGLTTWSMTVQYWLHIIKASSQSHSLSNSVVLGQYKKYSRTKYEYIFVILCVL